MEHYDQTTIENNIIYFPLWRVRNPNYLQWTWEARYTSLISLNVENHWAHNCISFGAILLSNTNNYCKFCGASRKNEPTDEAIHEYMDINYE